MSRISVLVEFVRGGGFRFSLFCTAENPVLACLCWIGIPLLLDFKNIKILVLAGL